MNIKLFLSLLIFFGQILIVNSLDCYFCKSSSKRNCKLTQKLESCNRYEDICMAVHYVAVFKLSRNLTKVISIYQKLCGSRKYGYQRYCNTMKDNGHDICEVHTWCRRNRCNQNNTKFHQKSDFRASSIRNVNPIVCYFILLCFLVVCK